MNILNGLFRFPGCRVISATLFIAVLLPKLLTAADWPMWRCDAGRTAVSHEVLPAALHLQWIREFPPLKPAFWQIRQERLQFDLGYEPVVLGKTMFIGSSRNDSVIALDTDTGKEKWQFFTEGPVRLAPVAWEQKVYVASDDGYLYCLDSGSGNLLWKIQGAPSNRRVLGNGRLVSVWPVRGGPVLADGRVYFAAGIWPFEGIFIYAVDARTGKLVWINDSTGSRYTEHPHGAMSFGGPSPQGYMLINQGRLVIPSSRSFPAFFDLETGKLLQFDFGHGGGGSLPGGWFLAGTDDGNLSVDPQINTEMHDGGPHTIGQIGNSRKAGDPFHKTVTIGRETYNVRDGISEMIQVGNKEFRYKDGFPGVEGRIHSMLAAYGKLFIVTRSGKIYCFGAKNVRPVQYPQRTPGLQRPAGAEASKASSILRLVGQLQGHALVLGAGAGRLAEDLVMQSDLQVVITDPDAGKIRLLRERLDAAGRYGDRLASITGKPRDLGMPPYFASLIICEDLKAAGFSAGVESLSTMFNSLRPYGGVLCIDTTAAQHGNISEWVKQPAFAGAEVRREGNFTIVVRAGPLPGAANYVGQANYDQLVKTPLGLLWFGDTYHHHKLFFKGYEHEGGRGLPTHIRVADGVLSYFVPREPQGQMPATMKYRDWVRQYSNKEFDSINTDIYTGRQMPPAPGWSNSVAGELPHNTELMIRKNPITGIEEVREYMKTYGCDTFGADYGNLITMRSGTPAFYDKRLESGTINVSGTRSGCRNSIVPACGVLNLPSWTGNCTCNYPLFTSLALAPMPQEYEQWSAWGGMAVNGPIKRVGINFGAPGDRMTEDGTLWLDWPSIGGPSPEVGLRVTPDNVESFYRHSLRMRGGQGWPWVFASGLKGVRSIQLDTVTKAGKTRGGGFSVRWLGKLEPQVSEEFTLHAGSDGPVRVWIDNRPLMDSTMKIPRNGQREATVKIFLNSSVKYNLLVEYIHTAGSTSSVPALVGLSWSSASTPRTVIPSERFVAMDGRRGGVTGYYYDNTRLSGSAMCQHDTQISFEWGRDLPAIVSTMHRPAKSIEQLYKVRLVFAEPDEMQNGQRVFSVKLQGKEVLKDFDIVKAAGGRNRGIVREFEHIVVKDVVDLEFLPSTSSPPLICGIEMIAEKL